MQVARDILLSDGFGRLSVEAVAARSGVSKPTIYRNWANAGELAMAALMADPAVSADLAPGDLAGALRAQMRGLVTAFATTRGRQITLMLAASDAESEMSKAFRNRIILSSRETGRVLIRGAVARGEIAEPADLETVLDIAYAPVFYRLLVGHLPLDIPFADSLVNRFSSSHQRPRPGPSVTNGHLGDAVDHGVGVRLQRSGVADGVGFEPTDGLHRRRFSRPVP